MRHRKLKLTIFLLMAGLGIYPVLMAAVNGAAGEAAQRGKRRTQPAARNESRDYFPHDKHEPLLGEASQSERDGQRDATPRFVLAAYHQDKAKAEEKKPEDKNAMCANCHKTYQPQGDSDDEYVTKPPKGLAE